MSGFQAKKTKENEVVIIRLSGFLDAHTAPLFEKEIEEAMSEKEYKMLIDLEKLDYISSAGLGVFMGYIEDIREENGDIVICNTSDKVYKVFDLLGFPNIFKIVKTEEEALSNFN